MWPIPRDDAAGQAASQVPLREAQDRETPASQDAHQFLKLRRQQSKHRPGRLRRLVGAGDAVVIVRGQGQEQLFTGYLFIAGKTLQAQATEFGGQGPTAGNVIPSEGGDRKSVV